MANLTEREAFASLLDHLTGAREAMRAIGLSRGDERWILTARVIEQVKDNAQKLMHKAPRGADKQRIWMPNGSGGFTPPAQN